MSTYTAQVTREGRFWSIYIPELDRHTQARTLAEVDEMARDLIGMLTDTDPEAVQVTRQVEAPADALARWTEAGRHEEDARAQAAAAARERREAVDALRRTYGLSADDTATVLGVSRARVYQLAK